MNLTPAELSKFYEGHMKFQAEQLLRPYEGQWIEVSGGVRDISSHGDQFALTLEDHRDPYLVLIFDRTAWEERLTVLQRGQLIFVHGRVEKVEPYSVMLTDCELVPAVD